mgnify:CR=1 FL=1
MQLSRRRRKALVPFMVLLALVACLWAMPSTAFASDYPRNDNLSEQLIRDRFSQINSSYAIGEEFTAEDADFVLRYGVTANTPSLLDSRSFTMSGSGYGTTVNVSGNVYHNGTFSYSYGANAWVNKTYGPTPRSMTLTVHCTSYGVVGSGGIGIIYNDSVSYTGSNTNSFNASPSRTYSGVMTSYIVETWVDVTTSSGNFFTIHE